MIINCAECGDEFDVVVIKSLGINKPISNLCHPCRAIKRANLETIEKAAILKELADKKSNWQRTSGIPMKFKNESFDTFKDRGGNTLAIKELCHQYANDFPVTAPIGYKSLGLMSPGKWGVGKSHLACSIAQLVLNKYASNRPSSPIYYITEPGLLRRIRSTFNNKRDDETEDDVYTHLINVPLLIVDDLGKEEVSDPRFIQRAWFSIINGRYENRLPIVITANLSPDGVESHLGGSRGNEAAFDRLWEMVGGEFWELVSTSMRKENV